MMTKEEILKLKDPQKNIFNRISVKGDLLTYQYWNVKLKEDDSILSTRYGLANFINDWKLLLDENHLDRANKLAREGSRNSVKNKYKLTEIESMILIAYFISKEKLELVKEAKEVVSGEEFSYLDGIENQLTKVLEYMENSKLHSYVLDICEVRNNSNNNNNKSNKR